LNIYLLFSAEVRQKSRQHERAAELNGCVTFVLEHGVPRVIGGFWLDAKGEASFRGVVIV
jgi:hypothetical protein